MYDENCRVIVPIIQTQNFLMCGAKNSCILIVDVVNDIARPFQHEIVQFLAQESVFSHL